jgi:putative endonuclease
MACFVYILKCADGSYYTGTSRDSSLGKRVSEHNNGHFQNAYTANKRPVGLVFAEEFLTIADAITAERRIKGWTRAKKEAMIEGRWNELPKLARRATRQFNK